MNIKTGAIREVSKEEFKDLEDQLQKGFFSEVPIPDDDKARMMARDMSRTQRRMYANFLRKGLAMEEALMKAWNAPERRGNRLR